MKNLRTIFMIAVCLVILSAAIPASAGGRVRGDADADGEVTILDATAIQRRLAGLPVSSFSERSADIDGNGLDILDATMIQRFLASLDDPYGIGEPLPAAPTLPLEDYELPIIRS